TNAHLSRYEVVTFELWQGRYLAAGILFLLITPVPLLAGYVLGTRVFRPYGVKDLNFRQRALIRAFNVFLGVFSALIALTMLQGLMWIISLDSVGKINRSLLLYFFVACGVTFLGAGFYWGKRKESEKADENVVSLDLDLDLYAVPYFVAVSMYLATTFGNSVYPTISPAYGGGGGWSATLYVDSATLGERVMGDDSSRVVVVNSGKEFLALLQCRASPLGKHYVAVAIPLSDVKALRLEEQVHVPAVRSACSGEEEKRPNIPVMSAAPARGSLETRDTLPVVEVQPKQVQKAN
ncbi:MAG TPA: hypothetical protein VLK84_25120, partial [Longimicrobium sp.]|nr:hypothetical protein [Longimicrobium sp.]